MDKQMTDQAGKETGGRKDAISTGIVFVVIGAALLIAQAVELGSVLFLLIAAVMLMLGVIRRSEGWFIPGGILAGLGVGVLLVEESNLAFTFDEGAVFLLALAVGFALITALTALFVQKRVLWPLIPAVLLALVGGGIMAGGMALQVLEFVGRYWPIGFILVGLYVIGRAAMSRRAA